MPDEVLLLYVVFMENRMKSLFVNDLHFFLPGLQALLGLVRVALL